MAEENKNYKEMWTMLADPDENWEYEPDAKLLASNVYFHSMMSAIKHLHRATGDFSLTDEEKREEIKNMRKNVKSASWVSSLYGALVDINPLDDSDQGPDLSGSKE